MNIIINTKIISLDSIQFYKGSLDSHASKLENDNFRY